MPKGSNAQGKISVPTGSEVKPQNTGFVLVEPKPTNVEAALVKQEPANAAAAFVNAESAGAVLPPVSTSVKNGVPIAVGRHTFKGALQKTGEGFRTVGGGFKRTGGGFVETMSGAGEFLSGIGEAIATPFDAGYCAWDKLRRTPFYRKMQILWNSTDSEKFVPEIITQPLVQRECTLNGAFGKMLEGAKKTGAGFGDMFGGLFDRLHGYKGVGGGIKESFLAITDKTIK